MILIDTLKNQLETEGYQVVKKKLGDENQYLSFLMKDRDLQSPMRSLLFFNAEGQKLVQVEALPEPN